MIRRKIVIVALVQDDRDRSGRGVNSIDGIAEGLTADLSTSLQGSRYNLTPTMIDTKIIDVEDLTAGGRQAELFAGSTQ